MDFRLHAYLSSQSTVKYNAVISIIKKITPIFVESNVSEQSMGISEIKNNAYNKINYTNIHYPMFAFESGFVLMKESLLNSSIDLLDTINLTDKSTTNVIITKENYIMYPYDVTCCLYKTSLGIFEKWIYHKIKSDKFYLWYNDFLSKKTQLTFEQIQM